MFNQVPVLLRMFLCVEFSSSFEAPILRQQILCCLFDSETNTMGAIEVACFGRAAEDHNGDEQQLGLEVGPWK